MSPLPTPPPIPMPQNGGGFTPPPTPQSGLMGYQQPAAAQVSDGLLGFLKNFMTMREASRSMSKQKFQEGIDAIMNGVPMGAADYEKIMKHGKKAGYDWLPTEPPTPEEMHYATQAKQQMEAQQAMASLPPQGASPISFGTNGMPAGDPATAALLASSQQAAGQQLGAPPAPQPGPSWLQRASRSMGLSAGPVSAQSPMGSYLAQLSQAAQASGGAPGQIARSGKAAMNAADMNDLDAGFQKQFGAPLKAMSAQQQASLIGLVKQGMSGDWKATDQLARMSNGWQLPMDQFKQIMRASSPELPPEEIDKQAAKMFQYVHMGGLQYQQFMMNYAKELAPNFQNDPFKAMAFLQDPGKSAPPAMSPQQYQQYAEGMSKFSSAYPTAPLSLLNQVALSQTVPGGKQFLQPALEVLNSKDAKGKPLFPRNGSEDARMATERLGYEYSRMGQDLGIHKDNLMMTGVDKIKELEGQKFEQWWKLAHDDGATGPAVRAAYEGLANSMSKYKGQTFQYQGHAVPIGDAVDYLENWRPTWPGGKPYVQPGQAPPDLLKDGFMQKSLMQPNGEARSQAYMDMIMQLNGMPQSFRQPVADKMYLEPEMQTAVQDFLKRSREMAMPTIGQ